MRRYLKMGLSGVLVISLGLISESRGTLPGFLRMEVKGVSLDATGQNPVVILVDTEGKTALPIWIGLLEVNAIDRELRNIASPRPMTHDLLHSILVQAHVKVKEVKIIDLKDNTYYATLFLKTNEAVVELDARPSDAIVIALKSKAPIFVSTKILDEQGIAFTKEGSFGERYGIRVQQLTPSLASHFNFKGQKGVLVSEVVPGSLAEVTDIKSGDIITKVNLKEVESIDEFEEAFDAVKAGNSIQMLLFRDDKFKEVSLFPKP
jgi:bifunctional DNase/RNase